MPLLFPVPLLLRDHGNRTFAQVLAKLRLSEWRISAPSPQLVVMLGREALFSEPLSIKISSRTVRTD